MCTAAGPTSTATTFNPIGDEAGKPEWGPGSNPPREEDKPQTTVTIPIYESKTPPPPEPAAAPAPAASPAPQFSDPTPQESAAQRLRRLSGLRLGLSKTIRTSPQGVTSSPLVSMPAAYFPGTKGKLGQ